MTNAKDHTTDTDCTLGADDACAVCGVYHGDPCPDCGGRGFHRDGCPRLCAGCGGVFEPCASDPRYCSEGCKADHA